MVIAIVMMAIGYPAAGWLGDRMIKRYIRGRLIVSAAGVFMGVVFLALTMLTPLESRLQFGILLSITAFFMPFAASNILATVYDITLPEVRSTSNAVFNFFEQIGSASAPSIAGVIAVRAGLGTAILSISVVAWSICLVMMMIAMFFAPRDLKALRQQLAERALQEKELACPQM
jgi:MFS family permease